MMITSGLVAFGEYAAVNKDSASFAVLLARITFSVGLAAVLLWVGYSTNL